MKGLWICLAAALVCVGCQYDPFAHLLTTHKPSPQQIAGRYKLTRQTVTGDGLAALKGEVSAVELFADGRFVATNLPPWTSDPPDARFFATLVSGSGSWRIDSVGGIDSGFGGEQTAWGVYLDSPSVRIHPAGFTGSKPPYGLIFTMSDPDLGAALFFERQD